MDSVDRFAPSPVVCQFLGPDENELQTWPMCHKTAESVILEEVIKLVIAVFGMEQYRLFITHRCLPTGLLRPTAAFGPKSD